MIKSCIFYEIPYNSKKHHAEAILESVTEGSEIEFSFFTTLLDAIESINLAIASSQDAAVGDIADLLSIKKKAALALKYLSESIFERADAIEHMSSGDEPLFISGRNSAAKLASQSVTEAFGWSVLVASSSFAASMMEMSIGDLSVADAGFLARNPGGLSGLIKRIEEFLSGMDHFIQIRSSNEDSMINSFRDGGAFSESIFKFIAAGHRCDGGESLMAVEGRSDRQIAIAYWEALNLSIHAGDASRLEFLISFVGNANIMVDGWGGRKFNKNMVDRSIDLAVAIISSGTKNGDFMLANIGRSIDLLERHGVAASTVKTLFFKPMAEVEMSKVRQKIAEASVNHKKEGVKS